MGDEVLEKTVIGETLLNAGGDNRVGGADEAPKIDDLVDSLVAKE